MRGEGQCECGGGGGGGMQDNPPPPDGKKGGGLVAGEGGLMSPSQELRAPWWRFKSSSLLQRTKKQLRPNNPHPSTTFVNLSIHYGIRPRPITAFPLPPNGGFSISV